MAAKGLLSQCPGIRTSYRKLLKKKREREKCRSICKVIAQVPRSANKGEKGVTRLLGKCIAGKIRIGDEG